MPASHPAATRPPTLAIRTLFLLLLLPALGIAQPHLLTLDPDVEQRGVEAWRAPGAIFGAACAECHGPDPLDLALMNVSQETILRRAAPHVDLDRALAIVEWTKALRTVANVPAGRDPREFRPFQPGGFVLPGATRIDRDLVFGQTLFTHVPRMMGAPIRTGTDAFTALQELRDLDLRQTPIGIAFNRWAEDSFHGAAAASTAEWLPELPHRVMPGHEAAWHALQDDYLQWPSDQNLWRIYDALDTHTKLPTDHGKARAFFRLKYRSVLVGMHVLRHEIAGGQPWSDRPSAAFFPLRMTATNGPNPVWMLGDFTRVNKGVTGWMGLPSFVVNDLAPHTTLRDEFDKMRVPWFWAGWLFDQGLQRTSGSNSTKSAEYLTHHLWTDSDHDHAIHNAFMITKKNVQQVFTPTGWFVPQWAGGSGPRMRIKLSNFAGYNRHVNWAPQDQARRAIYATYVCNAYRAFLIAYEGDFQAHGNVHNRSKAQSFFNQAQGFFNAFSGPELAADLAAVARVQQFMDTLPDA